MFVFLRFGTVGFIIESGMASANQQDSDNPQQQNNDGNLIPVKRRKIAINKYTTAKFDELLPDRR